MRSGSPAKPPLPVLVVPERPQVVPLPEVPPVDVGEVQFRVDGLPNHEIGEALGTGLDHQVRRGREDEAAVDVVLVDVPGVEFARFDLLGQALDGRGELVFPAEADGYLDRRVDLFVVVGPADRHRAGGPDVLKFPAERRDGPLVEDAGVDDDPVGTELERQVEEQFERVVGAGFEQVALGDDERDGVGEGGVAALEARGEIPVVEGHDRRLRGRGPKSHAFPRSGRTGPPADVEMVVHRQAGRLGVARGHRSGKGKCLSAERRDVTSTVRRAVAFALVGTLALVAPAVTGAGSAAVAGVAATVGVDPSLVATAAATAPFVGFAAFALTVDDDRAVFDLFARPGDRQDGTLYGLAGFSLAVAGLALFATQFGMPTWVFVGAVFALAFGNVAGNAVDATTGGPVLSTAGFVVGGFVAAAAGQAVAARLVELSLTGEFVAIVAFLAASGALLGALLRSVLFERDDPLVMVSIALLLWLLSDLNLQDVTTMRIAVALGVTVVLGYVAYALDTASLPGMLTGVFLGLLTMVLGDFRWFAMLITFFGLGGLSSKFRYEEKERRGIAQENEGARGSGNVLANSLVALVAVIGWAASPSHTDVDGMLFLYAFAGSIAAAMSDTLSSEIGGLYDDPRLITTFERVDPGTDGGVTWQGELAGIVGAGVIAGIAGALFESVDATGAAVILGAGVAGMTVDSLLGATVEGGLVDNQGVNLLATVAAALVGGSLALAVLV